LSDDFDKEPAITSAIDDLRYDVVEKDIVGANDEAMRIKLSILEEEHRDMDAAIVALEMQQPQQTLVIARLKKKKLYLKDQLSRLRDMVEPDIIA